MRRPTVFGQTTKYFAERQEARRKYILVYEGNQTEVQYFNGVIAHRNQLRVNPILELLPLLRSAADNTSSHPKIILQLLKEHFEEYKTAKVIIDKIVDYVIEVQWNGKCVESVATNLRKNLQDILTQEMKLSMTDEIDDLPLLIQRLSGYIETCFSETRKLEDLIIYINEQQIIYEEGYDTICIIIDRNKRNLEDYAAYVEECCLKGYSLFVSNPDFEFWLLLHLNQVFEYKPEDLLVNRKRDLAGGKSNKRYLEHVLSAVLGSYRKESIHFERFLPLIDRAIKNEKEFCEDIDGLEAALGSNVGILLEELRK